MDYFTVFAKKGRPGQDDTQHEVVFEVDGAPEPELDGRPRQLCDPISLGCIIRVAYKALHNNDTSHIKYGNSA